ncbi:hypothetical protein E1263_34515 [Kribbella antibiotica]|uniref:Uncharacterized protein n=1 Tax=Kribbella antibiotica TaxID=190195 RepID=A0A4R4YV16_9ACTN|nr:hypothetical protein [Kribbella antibiotica]TDD47482.1 hypothetical protein E1263_34515 [Kribbella antibiotica]
MTDTAAAHRLLDRLLAAAWDDFDAEELHNMSRARLANEFLRRMAVWGDVLNIEYGWPLLDLAVAVDPSVPDGADWLTRAEKESGREFGGTTQRAIVDMFQWALLGDQPVKRFPHLDDPYEPLLRFFERSGELITLNGAVELIGTSVRFRSRAERLAQPPFAIDLETLEGRDRDEQVRIAKMHEERRARQATRAEQAEQAE